MYETDKKNVSKKIWKQIKSLALLVILFLGTISISSAAGYTFTANTLPTPNIDPLSGDFGVPLTTASTPEYKWTPISIDFNLYIDSFGNPTSSNSAAGTYDLSQGNRWKEGIFTQKALSFGDSLSTTSPVWQPLLSTKDKLLPFFEANTRDTGISGIGTDSWSVPDLGCCDFTYLDHEGSYQKDSIADYLTGSADVLELFASETGLPGIENQISVITLKQGSSTSPLPRFSLERVLDEYESDGQSSPIFATLRAGNVYADKGLIGQHVAPQPNEAGDEALDPVLMNKIASPVTLNLEGRTNIGYGDTCQLYGQGHVRDGCPDGWALVNIKNGCFAKCRKITRIGPNPQEYGRCPALSTPDSESYKSPASAGPINCTDLVNGSATCAGETAAARAECGLTATTTGTTTNIVYDISDQGTYTISGKQLTMKVCLNSAKTSSKQVTVNMQYDYRPSGFTGPTTSSFSISPTITIPANTECGNSTVYKLCDNLGSLSLTSGSCSGNQLVMTGKLFGVMGSINGVYNTTGTYAGFYTSTPANLTVDPLFTGLP